MTDTAAPVVVAPDASWPQRARRAAAELAAALGPAVLRIDHIGSTAIAGMPAKDVLDLQVSVADLAVADTFTDWLDSLAYVPNPHVLYDHIPVGVVDDQTRWAKRFWSRRTPGADAVNVHVRAQGSPNERLALLFRDWFCAHPAAVPAYAAFKRSLAAISSDVGMYAEVKDPVVDLVMVVAEEWARATGWSPY